MIAVICAMAEERDALLKLCSDVKVKKGDKIFYHGESLDNEYYFAKIGDKEIIITRCGVGLVYAAIMTTLLIKKYKPELIINLGVAGSLNPDVHVNDIVSADRICNWRVDVPGWNRNIDSKIFAFSCDEKINRMIKKHHRKVKVGNMVSGDEFIYKRSQTREILKYYPDALCGEMEGAGIANTCYSFGVRCSIIRSISDETLINGNYRQFDFNLEKACDTAARLCYDIVERC
ncbi:MAG: 5'-methylthioadenosine/S-adenosylhomocysteine nucleosidase [Erysipelotrichaceae bacterium]|nr:5'-methylthioadenosine/S-adenosylhomocysteine nucleosidase [Erysipelotrichaceae bacterium]